LHSRHCHFRDRVPLRPNQTILSEQVVCHWQHL
jgi:hypothetical protein